MKNLRKKFDVLAQSLKSTLLTVVILSLASYVFELVYSYLYSLTSSVIIYYGGSLILTILNISVTVIVCREIAKRLGFSRKIGVVIPIVSYLFISILYIPFPGLIIESQYMMPYSYLSLVSLPPIFALFGLNFFQRIFAKFSTSDKFTNRLSYVAVIGVMMIIVTPLYMLAVTIIGNIEVNFLGNTVIAGLFEGIVFPFSYLTSTDVVAYHTSYISYYNETDFYGIYNSLNMFVVLGAIGMYGALLFSVKTTKEKIVLGLAALSSIFVGSTCVMLFTALAYKKSIVGLLGSSVFIGLVIGVIGLGANNTISAVIFGANLPTLLDGKLVIAGIVLVIALIANFVLTYVVMHSQFLSEKKPKVIEHS